MFANDDDMVECPYNNSHRMLRKRLQSHLLKCRIHYPDVELRKCPFNTTHLIPEPEFTHHVTNCSGRKLITQYKYDAPEPKEEEQPQHAPIESEENWDETDVADYDPIKYVENATVIRRPNGPTPSERKEFIKKERIRLGDADSDEDIDGNDDVIQNPNEDSRQQLRSRFPLTNDYQGFSRDKSPTNHERLPRDRSPTRPYRNRSPEHDVIEIPNDGSRERLRSRFPLTNNYQGFSRDKSPTNYERFPRDRSPTRPYRNRSPEHDVIQIPNDDNRERLRSRSPLTNNLQGFSRNKSPTNHQRVPRDRSPTRPYRNRSPEHDVIQIPNDDSRERLRSRSPLTNHYQGFSRNKSPTNHQRFPRDKSPARSYRNRSPEHDVIQIPNDDSRERLRSRSPLTNNYQGFSRNKSPTNHQRVPRDRSPARSYRNRSPEHRRPSNDKRTYNPNMDGHYSRNSQSYRDRSPNRHSTANDKRTYNKNHGDRDHYSHRSQRNDTRTYNSDKDPYYNSSSGSSNGFRNSFSHGSRDTADENPRPNPVDPGPRSYFTTNYKPTN